MGDELKRLGIQVCGASRRLFVRMEDAGVSLWETDWTAEQLRAIANELDRSAQGCSWEGEIPRATSTSTRER
jgi:hypothetical protein